MTVKTSISFTDRHHHFIKEMVDQGTISSVSSVVALGIEKLMQEEVQKDFMLEGLAETIRSRMETPHPDWVAMNESDPLFENVAKRLDSKS